MMASDMASSKIVEKNIRPHPKHIIPTKKDLSPSHYIGPRIADEFVDRYCKENKTQATILDIATGRGFVDIELVKKSFANIDDLDPCKKLLEIANTKKRLQNIL